MAPRRGASTEMAFRKARQFRPPNSDAAFPHFPPLGGAADIVFDSGAVEVLS